MTAVFNFDALEPFIEEILSAPGTDLATISAKRVRKSLQHIDPSLTTAFLKQHREAVDVVIARVFEKVQGPGSQDSEGDEPISSKRRQTPDDDGYPVPKEEDATDIDDTPPPAKKAKKAAVQRELTDAELARQLSSEINGRTRRTTSKPKAAFSNGSPKKRKSKSAKSAETVVDTDDESDTGDGKRPTGKKRSSGEGGGARGGFAKPYLLSEPLAAVLGVEALSRPQVVKQLWVYIKSNELNPDNKREIMCDSALRPVFNVDKIDMFKMNKVLGQHLHEME